MSEAELLQRISDLELRIIRLELWRGDMNPEPKGWLARWLHKQI